MRLISDVDWTELFERVSLVDDVLAGGSAFRDMDFPTRNLYRSAIEELARGSRAVRSWRSPDAAVLAARQASRPRDSVRGRPSRRSRLLPDRRRPARLRGSRSASGRRCDAWPGRLYRALGIGGYVGAGALVAAVLLALPLFVLHTQGLGPVWLRPAWRSWA